MNYKTSLICMLVLLSTAIAAQAQDPHIDPAAMSHDQSLTFARHVDSPFTSTKASQALQYGTGLIQRCDIRRNSTMQDTSCGVTVQRSNSVGAFSSTGDGLDIITTVAERNAVLNDTSAYVKVVTDIRVLSNGNPGSVNGYASLGGSSIVIRNGMSTNQTGTTLLHELGHNKGLGHRDDLGSPLMTGMGTSPASNEINAAECAAFHMGGTSSGPNRPVDVNFVIDDTGSMAEEIGAVRSALTTHLGTYAPSSCNAFRLTTFKDNVTQRAPTTDLAAIGSQVAGLVATGGADCPEASVEAINGSRQDIKDNGRVLLATDADAHPGLDIPAAIAALRARGIRVDVILSGSCSGSRSIDSENSQNTLGLSVGVKKQDVSRSASAIEDFSQMAAETGGIFAYIPEVNSGNFEDEQRFENTIFNIVQGGLTQSVALVAPSNLPVGSSAIVTITGASTNFTDSTALEIAGPGISVDNVNVLSPIQLTATVTIATDAAFGFRDVTATTELGTTTEVARGVGALLVDAPTGNSTILGITPAVGSPGTSFPAIISAVNTNFTDDSIVELGAGVVMSDVSALSGTQLLGTVNISDTAAAGFRDVNVLTGTELATESVAGPFLVSTAPVGLARLLAIEPAEASRGASVDVSLFGENTSFAQDLSILSFSGSGIEVLATSVVSETEMMAQIEVAEDADVGFRDVRVTTGSESAAFLGGFLVSPNSPPDCTTAEPSVSELWPANGQGVRVSLQGITDSDGDSLSTTVVGIYQDEPVTGGESGDLCPDAAGIGSGEVKLRAERMDEGDGRVYHVDFVASDDDGGTCNGTVTVCVPPDIPGKGPTCIDQGPIFESAGPCSGLTEDAERD